MTYVSMFFVVRFVIRSGMWTESDLTISGNCDGLCKDMKYCEVIVEYSIDCGLWAVGYKR